MQRNLFRHPSWVVIGIAAALGVGCAFEGESQDIGSASSSITTELDEGFGDLATEVDPGVIDRATDHANSGEIVNGRPVSWKLGGYTSGPDGEQTTCNYGWCGFINIDDCSLESEDNADGYGYGACNSSAWGERFAGYVWNGGENAHYRLNASGTTTFGYHPYWCIRAGDEVRTYQGWSYADSCAGEADFAIVDGGLTHIDLKEVGIGGDEGARYTYEVNVPEQASDIAFEIFGGTGAAELLVKRGGEPSEDDFDCRVARTDGVERCSGESPGSYQLLLLGLSEFSNVSIRGSYRLAEGGGPVCGDGVIEEGEDCEEGPCCTDQCTFAGPETSCRESAGVCDVAETCTGAAPTCPADAHEPDGTACPDGMCVGGVCEPDDGGGEPDPASCVETNACGGQAPAGCYCDSACTYYGDCCSDGPC